MQPATHITVAAEQAGEGGAILPCDVQRAGLQLLVAAAKAAHGGVGMRDLKPARATWFACDLESIHGVEHRVDRGLDHLEDATADCFAIARHHIVAVQLEWPDD